MPGRAPFLAALVAAAALAGCAPQKTGPLEEAGGKADRTIDETQGEVERAAGQTRRNLAEARKKAAETGEAVSETTKKAGEEVSREAQKATDAAAKMGEELRKGFEGGASPTPAAKR